tara:strand:+ start:359 stop:526 length:168 start_codon:yes stop_codon:yes gene_type:complete
MIRGTCKDRVGAIIDYWLKRGLGDAPPEKILKDFMEAADYYGTPAEQAKFKEAFE